MTRPRILLLHAFPLDCRMWVETKRALEEAGWPVSAPDLPGPDAAPTLGAWADRLLASVDGRLVPVGVSMGGYVAFELFRRARERVAALVLVATRAGRDSEETRRARDETIALLDDVGVTAVWEQLEDRLFAAGVAEVVVERARELALEQGGERLSAATAAIRDRDDATPLLAEIDVPTLVVAGAEDRVVPAGEAESLARAIPTARLVRIGGAGHLPPLERPEEFTRALAAFLDEVA